MMRPTAWPAGRPTRTRCALALLSLMTLLGGCAAVALPPQPGSQADPATLPLAEAQQPPAAGPAPGVPSVVFQPAPPPPVEPAPLLRSDSDPLPELILNGAPVVRSRLDPERDAERLDLWQRVRGGFAMADLDSDYVRKWEGWYSRDPAYVQRMTERGGRYLFHILEEVQKRGMPHELALLPFIESAFNPQAMSHAKASGMWQFMPGTGRDFELRQNVFRDDRRDVLASTRAALDYLARLNGIFNDWQLALAAYNWGQGNVMKALERNRREGLPLTYDSLRMPLETREYVPKLQAVKNIVMRPQNFGLSLPAFDNHPFFMSVPIERDIDVALAARLAGMSLEEFQQLNPQMNKPVILAAGTPRVLLPYDSANRFIQQLARHQGAMATWTAWVAPRTLKPAEAARITGMNEAQLRAVNLIPPKMLVKVGSTLLVPRAAHSTADVAEHVAENGAMLLAPEPRPLRRVSFKAPRQGATVAAVAQRYRISAAQVAQWNGTTATARFKPGQVIVVMLPAGQGGASKAGKAGKPAGAAKTATPATPASRTVRAAKAAPAGRKHR